MSINKIVSTQYQQKVDQAAKLVNKLNIPPEGWICTVRKALGMSVVQLAKKLSVTRASIFRTEKEELNYAVSMKTMHKIAEALGCRFVYAIVPEQTIQDLILQQAKLKARVIVEKANVNMGLEDQLLPEDKIQYEIDRLTQEILKEDHSDLWDLDWGSKK